MKKKMLSPKKSCPEIPLPGFLASFPDVVAYYIENPY